MFNIRVSVDFYIYTKFNKRIFGRTPLVFKPVTPTFYPMFDDLRKIFI